VHEVFLNLTWHPGFAAVQKIRNIQALHSAAKLAGYPKILEVSTKSDHELGQRLSAFNLRVNSERLGEMPLECTFQGSKVFEHGGPFTDLYQAEPRDAKRDLRLTGSGQLVGFRFDDSEFPVEPKTMFYDWLYLSCIYRQPEMTSLGGHFKTGKREPRRAWRMPDRSARNSAGLRLPSSMRQKSGSYTVPGSPRRRSPDNYRLAARPYAGFWADLFPRGIGYPLLIRLNLVDFGIGTEPPPNAWPRFLSRPISGWNRYS
jgi:hypothetical protein